MRDQAVTSQLNQRRPFRRAQEACAKHAPTRIQRHATGKNVLAFPMNQGREPPGLRGANERAWRGVARPWRWRSILPPRPASPAGLMGCGRHDSHDPDTGKDPTRRKRPPGQPSPRHAPGSRRGEPRSTNASLAFSDRRARASPGCRSSRDGKPTVSVPPCAACARKTMMSSAGRTRKGSWPIGSRRGRERTDETGAARRRPRDHQSIVT